MFRYVFWFRIMCYVKQRNIIKILFGFPVYLVFRHYEFKYGIHLNTNIQVGKGLKIVHGDGVYLNCKEIGEMFTVYQGVTLGVNGESGVPTVGNHVTVCTNSTVVGDIILGDNCNIGANSFVSHDVPCNTTVAGSPAKPIYKGKC